jgi:protease I
MPEALKVAILLEDQYEELELWYPYHRLREAGHEAVLIAPEDRVYHGKKGRYPARPDRVVGDAEPADYAAVVVPGGYAPDLMRRSPAMIEFLHAVADAGKPVAAICHAGWMLVSAGLVAGRRLTSFSSIRDDLVNAGAEWVDAEVVIDRNLITSRHPGDLPAFGRALVEALVRSAEATE